MDRPRDPRPGERPALSATARLRRLAQRLFRALRPPRRLRPTRAGWLFFAITFGIGFAALNTGNNLLYLVLSLLLAFLVLSGVLSESALRGIEVTRRLPAELQAEHPCSIGLAIHNHQQRVPSFALVIEDRLRDRSGRRRSAGRCFVLRVGPGDSELRSYRMTPEARGLLRWSGFEVTTRFPFGLFAKSLEIEAEASALVYPAIDAVPLPQGGATHASRGEGRELRSGHGSLVSGLREYSPGDPVRRIHWRRSLSRGSWLVRAAESEEQREIEITLPTRDAADAPAFEAAVRRAASEAVALLDAGLRVALRTDTTRIRAGLGAAQRMRLLDFLARVQPDGAAGPRA